MLYLLMMYAMLLSSKYRSTEQTTELLSLVEIRKCGLYLTWTVIAVLITNENCLIKNVFCIAAKTMLQIMRPQVNI